MLSLEERAHVPIARVLLLLWVLCAPDSRWSLLEYFVVDASRTGRCRLGSEQHVHFLESS